MLVSFFFFRSIFQDTHCKKSNSNPPSLPPPQRIRPPKPTLQNRPRDRRDLGPSASRTWTHNLPLRQLRAQYPLAQVPPPPPPPHPRPSPAQSRPQGNSWGRASGWTSSSRTGGWIPRSRSAITSFVLCARDARIVIDGYLRRAQNPRPQRGIGATTFGAARARACFAIYRRGAMAGVSGRI
ncbi:hypothetical protein L873DRAFT_1078070 [Choiromyces venosus 120613-1]|uniref:Uncharacterized protein n=1 Tax=Choiromyces venosus 120613-1 TaxID=1336337 RepID=A0A3N4JNC5_9PEZI|nr:hypothetical protein L873DRAFT_1078070 [Choiromyces venosus 120613-1]